MKASRIFTLLCMLTAAASVWSCQKKETDEPEVKPEIKVTGVTNSITFECDAPAKTFNVKANFSWTASVNQDWLTLTPGKGAADEVVTLTLTPEINETPQSREAKLTISLDGQDFVKEITVSQFGYDGPKKDTHPEGTVFFQDDFNWITGIWPEKLKDSKGGWLSVKLDGTNYNEFSLKNGYDDVDAEFDKRGYTYYADNSTYCRYDGSIKLGRTAQVGFICTPALNEIDQESVATLAVTFDASIYVSANDTHSANEYIKLQLVGSGEFKSAGTKGCEISPNGKTITVPTKVEHKWKWVRKQVIVSGADRSTAVQFGVAEALDARSFVDNIKIERVADNAVPAEDAVQPDPAFAKEIGTADQELYVATGGDGEFTATINRAWKASTTADWITIVSATAGKSGDKSGNVVAQDKKSVDVCASGCPYVIAFTVAENPVEKDREAVITISSEGQDQGTVTVKQAAAKPATKTDTHAAGYEFLKEDFNWITALYPADRYSYWGWPTSTTNVAGKTNDQQITNGDFAAIKTKLTELGWTYDGTETYPRYEGFIRMGRAAQRGSITTPVLAGIDAESQATIDVAFNVGMYTDAKYVSDTVNVLAVTVIGPGKIIACGSPVATIDEGGKSAGVTVENDDAHKYVWNRKHVIVAEATAETSIRFGKSEKASNTRHYIDDITVTRVADGTTTAAADAIVLDPLSKDFKLLSTEVVSGDGGEVGMSLRANRAYTVVSDAAWLTIKIASLSEKYGVTVAEDGLSASVRANGLEYCASKLVAAANASGAAREGHVTVTIEGEAPVVLTVNQAVSQGSIPVYGDPVTLAKWTWTGMFSAAWNGIEPVATSNGYKNAYAWINNHVVESDLAKGGTFSFYTCTDNVKDRSAMAYSSAANNKPTNMLRVNKLAKGDAFVFTFPGLTLAAGDKLNFKNLYLAVTNIAKAPIDWTEEYSLDGGNTWTTLKDIKINSAHFSATTTNGCLDAEFIVPEAKTNATLTIRIRVSTNNVSGGNTFADGTSDIAYLYVNPAKYGGLSNKTDADKKACTDESKDEIDCVTLTKASLEK